MKILFISIQIKIERFSFIFKIKNKTIREDLPRILLKIRDIEKILLNSFQKKNARKRYIEILLSIQRNNRDIGKIFCSFHFKER